MRWSYLHMMIIHQQIKGWRNQLWIILRSPLVNPQKQIRRPPTDGQTPKNTPKYSILKLFILYLCNVTYRKRPLLDMWMSWSPPTNLYYAPASCAENALVAGQTDLSEVIPLWEMPPLPLTLRNRLLGLKSSELRMMRNLNAEPTQTEGLQDQIVPDETNNRTTHSIGVQACIFTRKSKVSLGVQMDAVPRSHRAGSS